MDVRGMLAPLPSWLLAVVSQRRQDRDATMEHRRVESNWRFGTSVAAIVGGVGNLIHDGIVDGAKAGSVKLAKAASSIWMRMLGVAAKALGVVAAGIVAVLYLASSTAGVGVVLVFGGVFGAAILGVSATGVGLALVLVGIAIAILIDFFKTNELQEWMERCLFGAQEGGALSDPSG